MSDEFNPIVVAWDHMLAQLTATGATREDIADITMDTAHIILERTFAALYPDGATIPAAEQAFAAPLAAAVVDLARHKTTRTVPDVPDVTDPGEGA